MKLYAGYIIGILNNEENRIKKSIYIFTILNVGEIGFVDMVDFRKRSTIKEDTYQCVQYIHIIVDSYTVSCT